MRPLQLAGCLLVIVLALPLELNDHGEPGVSGKRSRCAHPAQRRLHHVGAEGDVKRFDEILADDFLCSMADGSLIDRKRFLEVTAQPVTIRNLQAHDVNIRLMGDMAIVHAATSFTTADGRPSPAATPTSGRGAAAGGSRYRRTSRGSSIRGVRVAIVGGPGVGKSTLVRQLADLYHNGSYGEGEKGVWDPRVLEDIAAGVNAVGVTEYFARLYDANYRDAARARRARQSDLLRGRAHHARSAHGGVPSRRARRTAQGPGDRRRVEPGPRDRADLEHRHHRKAHPHAQPRSRRRREHGAALPADRRRVPAARVAYPNTVVINRDSKEFHERQGLVDIITLAGLPMFARDSIPTLAVVRVGIPLAPSAAWPSQYPYQCNL